MKKILILFIGISISTFSLYSQNKTIAGRVITDQLETIPGVFIMINDTVEVGRSDLDGFFQIEIPATMNKISFKYVGIDPTTIELEGKCDKIEVVMMMTGTDDFMSLKRSERIRKKRYKKLPEIHRKAYENGIFKTAKACYNREFEPYYLDGN